jgi:putative transposase
VDRASMRYRSCRAVDTDVRLRIRELARRRRRFGYRRLHVLLRREGWRMNHQTLSTALPCREAASAPAWRPQTRLGRACAAAERGGHEISCPTASATAGAFDPLRSSTTSRVIDLIPDASLSGVRVAPELDALTTRRGRPKSCV